MTTVKWQKAQGVRFKFEAAVYGTCKFSDYQGHYCEVLTMKAIQHHLSNAVDNGNAGHNHCCYLSPSVIDGEDQYSILSENLNS